MNVRDLKKLKIKFNSIQVRENIFTPTHNIYIIGIMYGVSTVYLGDIVWAKLLAAFLFIGFFVNKFVSFR